MKQRLGAAAGPCVLPAVLLAGLLATTACRREGPAPPPAPTPVDDLETVEVAPPPDVLVDTSRDQVEVRRVEEVSGVLPSDYPSTLPLPSGASLVDQGGRWVEMLVPRPPTTVEGEYLRRVRAAGWEATADGQGAWRLLRNGVKAHATLSARGPSTQLRIRY
jgi:hypothetical protein